MTFAVIPASTRTWPGCRRGPDTLDHRHLGRAAPTRCPWCVRDDL